MNNPAAQPSMEALLSAGLPALALLVFLVIAVFAITGYSMKLAMLAAGVGRFGYWKSMGIYFLASLVASFVSVAVTFSMSPGISSALLAWIGSVFGFAFVVSTLGYCGLGRGLVTYLYTMLFSGAAGVAAVMLVATGLFVIGSLNPGKSVDFSSVLTEGTADDQVTDAPENQTSLFGDWTPAKFTDVFSAAAENESPNVASGIREGSLPTKVQPSALDAVFFESDPSIGKLKEPPPDDCQTGSCKKRNTIKKREKPPEPVSRGIQTNPFAN